MYYIIKSTIYKKILGFLLPVVGFVPLFLVVELCEYGSDAYNILGDISVAFWLLSIVVAIPLVIYYFRRKIVLTSGTIIVTPGLGRKRQCAIQDIRACVICKDGMVTLADKNSDVFCKYKVTEDKENYIIKTLSQNDYCVISVESKYGDLVTAEGGFEKYNQVQQPEEENLEESTKFCASLSIDKTMRIKRIDKIIELVLPLLSILLHIVMLAVFVNIFRMPHIFGLFEVVVCLILAFAIILFLKNKSVDYFMNLKFMELKDTFMRVKAEIIRDEKSKGNAYRHIYRFTDLNGNLIEKEDEDTLPKDYVRGSYVGLEKTVWYSPYWKTVIVPQNEENVLPTRPSYLKREKKTLPIKQIIKRHPIWTIVIVFSILFGFYRGYALCLYGKYCYINRDNKIVIDEKAKPNEASADWLKYSFYPYFYVNGIMDIDEFEAFEVKNYKESFSKELLEEMADSLETGWGITDRESLMNTTDRLLKRGDRYTYYKNLNQRSPNRVTQEELNTTAENLVLNLNLSNKSYYQHMGTYYAYNNCENGVDAWDYVRYIRLYAFGYMCGYVTYDEYLVYTQPVMDRLQKEYSSWEELYESYCYGYMIFLGRNNADKKSHIYEVNRYMDFEDYAEEVELDFK